MIKDKGLSVFMTRSAEVEPWLIPHAFVAPPEFEFFKASNSCLIYARSGTGNTALSQALEAYACNELKCLPVKWTPELGRNPQALSTDLAMAQFSGILSACAQKILSELPKEFKKRAREERSLDFMTGFLHRFSPPEHQTLLIEKVPVPKNFLIQKDIKLEAIAVELIKSMRLLGFPGGIWILTDAMEQTFSSQSKPAIHVFQSILATLPLFEITGFHFKLILPLEFERELTNIPARIKERVTASRISWEPKQLRSMIEKRLRLALGDDKVKAEHIYSVDELFGWLEGCGGQSPRGWLEYFRPIFASVWENYETEGLRRLNKKEWNAARKRSSLQLRFYPDSREVVVGMNAPRMLSLEELAIFSYLYENEGRYCSKREIYNKAYLPFNTGGKGRELDPQEELSKEYDDLVNTAIHRLRKSIEPLPKDPVFLTMKKNQGYRLSRQAFVD